MGTPSPDHSARSHAEHSPSKLNYLDPSVGGCPGFLNRESTSEAAEEGTAHHETLDVMTKEFAADQKKGSQLSFEGLLFARRIALKWDDETDELYRFCAKAVQPFFDRRPEIVTEQRVEVKDPLGKVITWGHYDLRMMKSRVAVMVDWKFGWEPVLPASENRQGWCYSVGIMQEVPDADKCVVLFVQPRLNVVSKATFERKDIPKMVNAIERIVDRAKAVHAMIEQAPNGAVEHLNPGTACRYCDRRTRCPAFLRGLVQVGHRTGALHLPTEINLAAIDTPEKAAVVAAWCDFVGDALDDIKAKATDIAKKAGGRISYTAPDGDVVSFKLQKKFLARSVGNAVEVAEVFKEYVAPEQLLSAAKLGLESLLAVVVPAMMEMNPEIKTKKAAEEAATSMLEVHGLLTRPDGYTTFLKREKTTHKQITKKS